MSERKSRRWEAVTGALLLAACVGCSSPETRKVTITTEFLIAEQAWKAFEQPAKVYDPILACRLRRIERRKTWLANEFILEGGPGRGEELVALGRRLGESQSGLQGMLSGNPEERSEAQTEAAMRKVAEIEALLGLPSLNMEEYPLWRAMFGL